MPHPDAEKPRDERRLRTEAGLHAFTASAMSDADFEIAWQIDVDEWDRLDQQAELEDEAARARNEDLKLKNLERRLRLQRAARRAQQGGTP
jgi:hypothetical protein